MALPAELPAGCRHHGQRGGDEVSVLLPAVCRLLAVVCWLLAARAWTAAACCGGVVVGVAEAACCLLDSGLPRDSRWGRGGAPHM
eukprot:COSAG02_NODE_734_length_17948_cov_816.410163_10_plen_85_part_00